MEKTILVIDDEAAIRNSFELTFENSSIKVITAEDGEIGLKKFQEQPIDIIFLDLKMSKMTGVEVLEQIREKDKHTPVYIITAFQQEFFNDLLKLREEKKNSFQILQKPLDSNELRDVVKSLLET